MSKTIKYETAPNHSLATPCPYGMRNPRVKHWIILVNSMPCWNCQYYGHSNYNRSIECNHP